ncbi:MAG TPA: hypothetical protein VJA45_05845 [Methylomirabilota bacterium]|nr:hypothetical protein [Methylomirabilota bacterium]
MALRGGAVLAIWNDIAPGGDAEFNHWHTREHVPERVGIAGFLRGRRYEALAGSPRYFTLYETESVTTLNGPAYLARLNEPTPWTRSSLQLFRNNKRTVCRVALTLGHGIGGALATLDLGPALGRDEDFKAWLTATTLPAIADRPGIVGAHFCQADVAATQVKTEEKKLRDRADALARWVLLVEGLDRDTVEGVCRDFLSAETLTRHGAAPDVVAAVYRLTYSLSDR